MKQRSDYSVASIDRSTDRYFEVITLIKCSQGTQSWALVKECTLVSPKIISQLPDCNTDPTITVTTEPFYSRRSPEASRHHYLDLNGCVSKVGVLHNCSAQGTCKFEFETKRVVHSTTTLEGGSFLLLMRGMGYPPRRS